MHWPALLYHPCYSELQLPDKHRYPIGKYRALYQALLAAGVPQHCFIESEAATAAELLLVHQPDYIQSLQHGSIDAKAMRRIGFPWSQQLYQRSLTSVGGTVQTAQLALEHGLALHLSGGYHHAFAHEGSGFCLFNDLAIAARVLQQQGVDKILIFDCDVHQGDGTALIFQNDANIITASLHGEKNFPARKQQSDWDVALPNLCCDPLYLEAVQQSLDYLLDLHQPDVVLYDAGVDIHQHDDLGLLQISTAGVLARDSYVINSCRERNIALAAVIGGGYQRDLTALTAIHLQLFKAAFDSRQLPHQIP